MSAQSNSPSAPPPRPPRRLQQFWKRVTEGQAADQLWRQMVTDARASYRFYSSDVEQPQAPTPARFHRFLHLVKEFFWAILTKLTPARRVLLLIGVLLLLFSSFVEVDRSGDRAGAHVNVELFALDIRFWGGVVILLVLIMELGDRVTMKRDLEIARDIQHWLVPETPPSLPKVDIAFTTRPANTVSGDYYDVFPWPSAAVPGRYLLVVADVAGKSVPAALLMATFHASLHSLVGSTTVLLELVAGVNKYVSAHSLGGARFTTALIADLDVNTGEINYVNAGHNAPMLRRSNGAIERLEAGGLPLGILEGAVYEQGSRRLNAGETLIIFTDGVVEATNPGGEEFGEGRLLNCVFPGTDKAGDLLGTIMLAVDAFVNTAPQADDITCMILRFQDSDKK